MKNIHRFSVFFKESSLLLQSLLVAAMVSVVIGTVTVAALKATRSDNKPDHAATNSMDEQEISDEEPVSVSDDEKPSDTASNPTAEQTARQQPASTPEESPKDDNTVTVKDIPQELFGWSEYHAYKRRIEVGKPEAIKGVAAGHLFAIHYCRKHSMTTSPSKYAIVCLPSGTRGHMAFVESINTDGSIRITEMNYKGWNRVSERIIPEDQAAAYRYIP